MTDTLRYIQDYSIHLKKLHSKRVTMQNAMEKLYLMDWDDEARVGKQREGVRITKSPDPRNKLGGAIELLIAADPTFSVPAEKNVDIDDAVCSKIEKWATKVWQASSKVRGMPLHYDLVTSAMTFGEVHVAVTRTADLVAATKGAGKQSQRRAEEIAQLTPYLYDVWDPRTGYPDIGPLGLRAYYREIRTTSGVVLDEFGQDAVQAGVNPEKRYDPVTLCRFWDEIYDYSWLLGQNRSIREGKHGLPFIPVVAQIAEGSKLWSQPEYQRQPFLYTVWRSGMWERQNLALTVFFTTLYQMGLTPTLMYTSNGGSLDIDWDNLPAVINLEQGERLEVLASKGLLDPSFIEAMNIAETKITESTIYDQALGEPLGKNAPFSMVALLHQAGRLPLIQPQRNTSNAIADVSKMALQWWKEEGSDYEDDLGLEPGEVPEIFELDAKLDISLPEDKLQDANIAKMLVEGDDPITSHRYAREHVLGIGQSDEMDHEVWTEKASRLKAEEYFLMQMLRLKQMREAAMNPQQPMAPEMGQQPPMQGPPMMPPEGPPPGPEGLPPEMIQGGMQGPAMPGQRMTEEGEPNVAGY